MNMSHNLRQKTLKAPNNIIQLSMKKTKPNEPQWKLYAPVEGKEMIIHINFESKVKYQEVGWNKQKVRVVLINTDDAKILHTTNWYDASGCSYALRSAQSKAFKEAMEYIGSLI